MVESEQEMNILTIRELEVLKLIAKGYCTKEISVLLKISHFTVETINT